MKKTLRSTVGIFLSFSLLLGFVPGGWARAEGPQDDLAASAGTAEAIPFAAADVTGVEYTIYPLPREITYGNTGVEIPQTVNVVYGPGIDRYTKDHLADALAQLNVTAQVKDTAVSGGFNILVGVRGANDAADQAMRGVDSAMTIQSAGQSYTEDIFTGAHAFDAYMIRVDADGIAVVGKDTDAAFYGITTLKHIFAEMAQGNTSTIRAFTLRDYASVAFRGFIEGYYGLPWSHESRQSLMEWGGEWKMNMYVFAPKDDPYHNSRWRDPYPAADLRKQAELAETGNRTKNRYVYALHPFMSNPIALTQEQLEERKTTFEAEVKVITDKFDSLYNVGVRQFAILADDAGSYDGQDLARLMNALNDWRETKGDVYPLQICPDAYNASWSNANAYAQKAKLNHYMDDDVQIYWTGLGVCGHATKDDANCFVNGVNSNKPEAGFKDSRTPLMWLNWPVNDINMSRLLLGPGSNEGGANGYSTKVAVLEKGEADYFTGIISNPMQQAELNKIPLFAVADFAWNDDDYNGQQSWADSFQFVDPEAAEALHTLAKHMSDPSPNSHAMNCGESEELKDQLTEFLNAYTSGGQVAGLADGLIREFETIIKACDDFAAQSRNQGMLEEINSHRRSLRDLCESAIAFINTAVVLERGENAKVWTYYSEGLAKQASAKTYPVPLLSGGNQYAQPGAKRIVPFVDSLSAALAEPVQRVLDPDYELPVTPGFYACASLANGSKEGAVANVSDYDASTYIYYKTNQEAGMYVGWGFEEPATVQRFRIISGKPGDMTSDRFFNAVLEYRVKGEEEFKPVPDGSDGVFTTGEKIWDFTSAPLKNVVDIRARLLDSRVKWLGIFEFGPYDPDDEPVSGGKEKYTATAFKADSLTGNYYTSLDSMVDNDMGSYAYVYHGGEGDDRDAVHEGEYVGVDLGSTKSIGTISIKCGPNNKLSHGILEYSTDGENYTVLRENLNTADILVDCSNSNIMARYIRLRSAKYDGVWLMIYDFSVEAPYSPVFRSGNMVFGQNNESAYGPDRKVIDGDDTTYAHYGDGASNGNGTIQADEYIGLRLDKKTSLGRIRILQGTPDNDRDKLKNAILEYSDDNESTYHTILDNINENVIDVDLSSSGIKATHVRFRNGSENSGAWLALRTFSVEEATSTDLMDTNAAAYAARRVAIGEDRASIGPMFDQLTLAAGEYIGIKLPRIRELNGLTVNGGVPNGLTLMVGCNELELNAVDSGVLSETNTRNARYIRLVNNGSSDVTFSFNGLTVTSKEIQEPSIVSSTMGGPYDNQPASNLFDGDLGTEYIWAREQDKDTNTVIDIGQVMHIDSLQLIVNDSMNDWIRCAVVEGSLSPDGPWEKLVDIGKADSTTATSMGEAAGWLHTISYNYAGSKEGNPAINKDVRYLKITLKNDQHVAKWSRIREIGINNLLVGNEYTRPYMAEVNDPTFEGTREVQGHAPQNLTDGNVSTTYIPESKNGHILYRLSEELDQINQVSVLQSPNTLSNATVSVRAANSNDFVSIGSLSYSMNEFALPVDLTSVAEIRIDWTDMAPELHEILAVHKTPDPAKKDALIALLGEAESFEESDEYKNGIQERIDAYSKAKAEAEEARDNALILQSGVDQAVNKLSAAIEAIRSLIPVQQVTLSNDMHSATLYTNPKGGQVSQVTLTADVLPAVATDKTVTWSSADPSVATVAATGAGSTVAVVTAKKPGTVMITVTSLDNPAAKTECRVTVKANPTGITVAGGEYDPNYPGLIGQTYTEDIPLIIYTNEGLSDRPSSAKVSAVPTPAGAENGVTWNYADGSDANNSLVNIVRGQDPGVCTIQVTNIDPTKVGKVFIEATSTSDPTVKARFQVQVRRYLTNPVTVSTMDGAEPRPGARVQADINRLVMTDDGKAALQYQWLRNREVIPGATDKTYTLTEQDIGKRIQVGVTADGDTSFYEGEFASENSIQVLKNAAPAAPTLSATKVTNIAPDSGVITIAGWASDAVYEMSSDNGANWEEVTTTDGTISGLSAGTYMIRLAEAATHDAGRAGTITVQMDGTTYYRVGYTVTPPDAAVVTLDKSAVEAGGEATATVEPERGYEISTVTADGFDVRQEGNSYSVYNVGADVTFAVDLEKIKLNIAHDLTHLSCSLSGGGHGHQVDFGTAEVITLVPDEGYDLPNGGDIRITRDDGSEFTAYTYSMTTGTITITGGVTENLTITATGVRKAYQVAYANMVGVTGPDNRTAAYGQDYTAVLTAQKGYKLPQTITVVRGGVTLVDGEDYTYDPNTGAVTIFAAAVTGNLSVSAVGETSLIPLESVSISGAAQVGKTLTANVSPAEAAYDVNYQWLWVAEDGTETVIEGATGMSRVVTAISLGKRIAVRITPDNDSEYAGMVTSQPTAPVIAADAPTVPVSIVALDRTAVTMEVGNTTRLNVTVRPSNATDQTVTWSSGNSGVATVDGNGTVTAVAPGSAVITVTNAASGISAVCTITVKENSGSSSGGDSGSSSGGSSPTNKTETVKNADGSTTTTVTDRRTGTVTVTTTWPDGKVEVVETRKNGTVINTTTEPDGKKVEKKVTAEKDVTITVTSPRGETVAQVKLPGQIPAPETKFEDVPTDHWAEKAINTMAGLGLVKGVGENRYDMTSAMTRGSLATVLYRLSNGRAAGGIEFGDVEKDEWYAESISWAAKYGIVQGVGENLFKPKDIISREQLAVMLRRYAQVLGMEVESSATVLERFSDGEKTGEWAAEGVAWCVEKGILQGKGGSVLDPKADVSRAEVAVMLERFMELMR